MKNRKENETSLSLICGGKFKAAPFCTCITQFVMLFILPSVSRANQRGSLEFQQIAFAFNRIIL